MIINYMFRKNNLFLPDINPLQQITFSPSWNLRMQFSCEDNNLDIIKNILKVLFDYNAEQLSAFTENKASQTAQYTISIASKNVFSFLKTYCAIEAEEIAFYIARAIEKNPQSGFNFLVKKV